MASHKVFNWSFNTKVCGDTIIMICIVDEEGEEQWEIYYKRPHYPFMFAFGLPYVYKTQEVLKIAEENIDSYADMFN